MSKNLKEFIIALYKGAFILIMSAVFFIFFSSKYDALKVFSRTLAITLTIYSISYLLFINIYGNFQIGREKSKQVIYGTFLAVFFTDVLTYFALIVMSTNPNNIQANQSFRIENLNTLLIVFLIQLTITTVAAYFGNFMFFSMNKPKRTLVLFDSNIEKDSKINKFLASYAKEYTLIGSKDINDFSFEDDLKGVDFVVFSVMDSPLRTKVSNHCYLNDIDFSFTPTISDVIEMSGYHLTYDDVPVVKVDLDVMSFYQRVMKRCIDLFFALIIMIITSPLWILIYAAIKFDDGGPVFFKQERMTIRGRVFNVYKFRSMKVDSKNYSATAEDDRITRVGKLLRKLRIDELPQMVNIIKGDMSIVGPRPEMLENIQKYEKEMPEFRYRLKVKAGLTGIAQIEGKYNTTPRDKLIMDLIYIENYSVWFDVKLIFKTAIVFFKNDSTEGFSERE